MNKQTTFFGLALAFAVASFSAAADSVDGKSVSAMGPVFRKYSVAYYGKWLPTWVEEKDRTREGYRVWLDMPCGKGEETKNLNRFITGLIVATNDVAATVGKQWRPLPERVSGLEAGIRYRRDMCFAVCEKGETPTGGMLRGTADFADGRYVSYTVSEHCWYMDKNAGEFVIARGVFDRKLQRRITVADLFAPEVREELAEVVRKAYAVATGGDAYPSWQEFRKRYPKELPNGVQLKDPVPGDNFLLDDYGMIWSFNDAEIVGDRNRRTEHMLDVPVSWRSIRKLLRDRSIIPEVNSIWDCNMYRVE